MRRILLTSFIGLILVVPSLTSAQDGFRPENFIPAGGFTLEVEFNGKLKDTYGALLRKYVFELSDGEAADPSTMREKIMADTLLNGERMFFSFYPPQEVLLTFPITNSEWTIFITGLEKETVASTEIYFNEATNLYAAHLGSHAVLATSRITLYKSLELGGISGLPTVDSAEEKVISIGADPAMQKLFASYLAPRFFSLSMDINSLRPLLDPLFSSLGQATEEDRLGVTVIGNLLKLITHEGISIAEWKDGYVFNVKALGNEAELNRASLSLNPSGSFIPSLYKKFPNEKVIIFGEGFNAKAEQENADRLSTFFLEGVAGSTLDAYSTLSKAIGFDFRKMNTAFTKGNALAVQYNKKSPIPYITLLAEVSDTRQLAQDVAEELIDAVDKNLKKLADDSKLQKFHSITTQGAVSKITLDPRKAIKEYKGPALPKITFTIGVTSDDYFVISNYPDIENTEKRNGQEIVDELARFDIAKPVTNISYFNMRNVWGYLDSVMAWAERVGKDAVPLDFYSGYYAVAEKIYGWRDLMVISEGNSLEGLATGFVTIDNAKHTTYSELISGLKGSDSDSDGINDYEERYVYHTAVDNADVDGDGVEDFQELLNGSNPEGEGRLFSDVAQGEYYTDEVGLLYQRGSVKGYSSGLFEPGRVVNRAEFVTMVVKTFETDTSAFLGVNVDLPQRTPPFDDVDSKDWYYKYVAKAYTGGFISGSFMRGPSGEIGGLMFRPGDPITRAEALAILNKASEALSKNAFNVSCEGGPFNDVSSNDWFCQAVANGYENGVTAGKTPTEFRPHDSLTRAEAAVMIRRTLEKDLEAISSKAELNFRPAGLGF